MKINKALVVVLVIFVIGIVYYGFLFYSGNLETPIQNNSEDISGKLLIQDDNAIAVTEQEPGTNVYANFVLIKDAGFVVVHEINTDGSAGNIVGVSAFLPAGQSNGISITLSKQTKDGKQYIAEVYKDNGDGIFNKNTDGAVLDGEGNIIQTTFSVATGASPVDIQL